MPVAGVSQTQMQAALCVYELSADYLRCEQRYCGSTLNGPKSHEFLSYGYLWNHTALLSSLSPPVFRPPSSFTKITATIISK